jgi:hypothetical protein
MGKAQFSCRPRLLKSQLRPCHTRRMNGIKRSTSSYLVHIKPEQMKKNPKLQTDAMFLRFFKRNAKQRHVVTVPGRIVCVQPAFSTETTGGEGTKQACPFSWNRVKVWRAWNPPPPPPPRHPQQHDHVVPHGLGPRMLHKGPTHRVPVCLYTRAHGPPLARVGRYATTS